MVFAWLRHSLVAFLSTPMKKDCEINAANSSLSKLQARLLLVMCAAMYGSNFVGTKILQNSLAPSLITTCRFFIGSLFFVHHIYKFRGDIKVFRYGIELGIWTAMGFMIQAITLQYTSANKNAFLCALSVVMIPIFESFSYCCYGNKSHTQSGTSSLNVIFIPAFLSLLGIASLEWGGIESPTLVDIAVLLAPACFAMGFWRTEQIAGLFPHDTAVLTGTLLSTTTFCCFLYSILSGEFPLSLSSLSLFLDVLMEWKVLVGLIYAGLYAATRDLSPLPTYMLTYLHLTYSLTISNLSIKYIYICRCFDDCLEFVCRAICP
jgi:hypothetical protein